MNQPAIPTPYSHRQARIILLFLAAVLLSFRAEAQTNQPASLAYGPASGGAGDSMGAILSPDGRYVLFASAAANLVSLETNSPLPVLFPAPLNVFLRDRSNATTTLVSVNMFANGGGNADSLPVDVSTNGRFVLFESSASNLVANDTNGVPDVFVRDLLLARTLLVSVSTGGGVANGACRGSAMTPDGRYVAFISGANNLVAGDTNGIADVFVRDLQAGTTVLASAGAQGGQQLSIPNESAPELSADGRYVLFHSTASNLLQNVTTTNDLYVRDLANGLTFQASAGALPAIESVTGTNIALTFNYAFSADGQYVAYEASPPGSFAGLILRYNLATGATDLVHTNAAVTSTTDGYSLDMTPDGRLIAFIANTNGAASGDSCVLVWDAQTGSSTLASGAPDGTVPAVSTCDSPVLSPDGRFVAFLSSAAGLVTNALHGDYQCYLRDLQARTTVLINADTNGAGWALTSMPVPFLDAAGQTVAFEAPDGSLVAGDHNRSYDVFVRDVAAASNELVSVRDPAFPSLSPNGPSELSPSCASADGRMIVFASAATDLVLNDTNGATDVFVRDLLTGSNILVSVAADGVTPGDGISFEPSISADGRYVVFTSAADNLVPGDTNNATDVFVRDLWAGVTRLVSAAPNGISPGNARSHLPMISASGLRVVFSSNSTNLAPVSAPFENLFWRDLSTAKTYALSSAYGGYSPSMSPDGRFVAFVGNPQLGFPHLYVWDAQQAAPIYTNSTFGIASAALSPDARRVIYLVTGSGSVAFYAFDLVAHTNALVTTNFLASQPGLSFSSDGHFLTYAARSGPFGPFGTNQVYRYDFWSNTTLLVSHSFGAPGVPGNGNSDSPNISADGRFVAFRSAATDLLASGSDGSPDVLLFDAITGNTTLVSVSRLGNYSADSRSLSPFFSGDGHSLFFGSSASDLVPFDFSINPNVYAYGLFSATAQGYFSINIIPEGQNQWLSWPTSPSTSYRVQFKNDLLDPAWQDLNGSFTVIGNTAYFQDPSSAGARRFYRVVGF